MQDAYNGFGQLVAQYQAHTDAVNVNSTPKVQYAYTETNSGSENDSRLTSLTYPNGRKLDYVYNSGLDSTISRVSSLNDDAGTYAGHALEAYTYLGLSTIVQRTRDNGIDLSYLQQTGDTLSSTDGGDKYTGLDRFGRVIDQYWLNPSTPSSPTDRFQYGYDPDGNVLFKNNLVSSSNSELYHANGSSNGYDLLNRLINFQRGTLTSDHTSISGTASRTLNYSLDSVGNQTAVSGSLSNTRTFNTQNQITAQTGLTVTPTYDNNGNMTRNGGGQTFKYDAWNRQVAAVGTSEVFAYDANGRRPSLTICGPTVTDSYYSADWQVLQEGTCGGTTATSQYVWGMGYVDDLVLRDDNSTTGSLGKTSSGLGRRLFAQQDANFNVTTLTTTTGTVQVRIQYDPYGVPTFLTAAWGTGGSLPTGWEPLFQGLRYDSTAKTYDGRNRIYDPALGVWMQDDPLGYVDGANRYEVEQDNAISRVDPFGLQAVPLPKPLLPEPEPYIRLGPPPPVGSPRPTIPVPPFGGINPHWDPDEVPYGPGGIYDGLPKGWDPNKDPQTDPKGEGSLAPVPSRNRPAKGKENCACQVQLVPPRGGSRRHNDLVNELQGHSMSYKVTTPEGESYEYDGIRGGELFDLKTGHEWLALDKNILWGSSYLSSRMDALIAQMKRAVRVAMRCKMPIVVYFDNYAARYGFVKHFGHIPNAKVYGARGHHGPDPTIS